MTYSNGEKSRAAKWESANEARLQYTGRTVVTGAGHFGISTDGGQTHCGELEDKNTSILYYSSQFFRNYATTSVTVFFFFFLLIY